MKKVLAIIGLTTIIALSGCGEASVATLEPEGVEAIEVEQIVVEEIHVKPIEVTSYEDVTNYWAD